MRLTQVVFLPFFALSTACAGLDGLLETTPAVPRAIAVAPTAPFAGVGGSPSSSGSAAQVPRSGQSAPVPAAPGPCGPMQVAPGVWVAPDCSAPRPTMRTSPFVGRPARVKSLQGSLPAEVDLRRSGLDGPIKNQEMVGICWSFAVSTVMDNAIRRAGRREVIAPLHVVSSKVWTDIWGKGRSSRDLTVEPSWPYNPVKGCKLNEAKSEVWCENAYGVKPGSWRSDPELVTEIERANRSGAFRISGVEALSARPGNPEQIASVVAAGQAVYASFDYSQRAWADTGSSGAVIPDYAETDGGHAVVIVGYRPGPTGRQFLLHNSWGPRWRDGGYAWISEAMVRAHLLDAFTVEVAPSAGTPSGAPDPVTPAPNVDAACPAGQGRDGVFGWCAPLCADGAAPHAMLCRAGGASGTGSPSCAAGQSRDWISGTCRNACPSRLPPVGGICVL